MGGAEGGGSDVSMSGILAATGPVKKLRITFFNLQALGMVNG